MANAGIHSFTLGTMHVTALSEGQTTKTYDFATRYPNATPGEVAAVLERFGAHGVQAMNLMLVQTEGTTLLLDTGNGADTQPDFGHLMPNLRAAGAGQVDIVFITHFHGDHIRGLTNPDGSPAFPAARIVTGQVEWDYWMGREDFPHKAMLESLGDQVETIAAGDVVAPGISTVALPGHTPGQLGLRLESEGEAFTHLADALHHPAQVLYPQWSIKFDSDPEQAAATRRSILEQAADSGERVMFYHLPFPGSGYVRREEDAFTFEADRS